MTLGGGPQPSPCVIFFDKMAYCVRTKNQLNNIIMQMYKSTNLDFSSQKK